MKKPKDTQILMGIKRLDNLVELVPGNRKQIAEKIAREIAFMAQTLDNLKLDISKRGAVELFKQGKQEFLRESPALKAYNTTIQRYSLLYKQLTDLLPKQSAINTDNALLDYLVLK